MSDFDAGYSGKPLVQKLGYKPGESVYVFGSAPDFETYLLEQGVLAAEALPADWLHGFFSSKADVMIFVDQNLLDKARKGVWVSWPKKSSSIETDVTEQTFRDLILPTGWVDVKVVAVDQTWSGLLFRRRVA